MIISSLLFVGAIAGGIFVGSGATIMLHYLRRSKPKALQNFTTDVTKCMFCDSCYPPTFCKRPSIAENEWSAFLNSTD